MESLISMDTAMRRLQQAWAEGLHTAIILVTQAGDIGFPALARIVGSTLVAEAITQPGSPPLPGTIAISPADVASVRQMGFAPDRHVHKFELTTGMTVIVYVHPGVYLEGEVPVGGKPRISSVKRGRQGALL